MNLNEKKTRISTVQISYGARGSGKQMQSEKAANDIPYILSDKITSPEEFLGFGEGDSYDSPQLLLSSLKMAPEEINDNAYFNNRLACIPENTSSFLSDTSPISDGYTPREIIIIKSLGYFSDKILKLNVKNFALKTLGESINERDEKVYAIIKIGIERLFQRKTKDRASIAKKTGDKIKEENINLNLVVTCLIISISNIVNEWVKKKECELYEEDNGKIYCDIFTDIFHDFEFGCEVCEHIDKELFKPFAIQNNLNFNFLDLFRDLFWDNVFRISSISFKFLHLYKDNNLSEEMKTSMKLISDSLLTIKYPLKKQIAEKLNIGCILKEKIFLANFIIDYKKKSPGNLSPPPAQPQQKSHDIESNDEILTFMETPAPKKKGKRKKKKKPKNTEEKKELEDNENDDNFLSVDPIVEKFKNELSQAPKANDVQKIKPFISAKWIELLSVN